VLGRYTISAIKIHFASNAAQVKVAGADRPEAPFCPVRRRGAVHAVCLIGGRTLVRFNKFARGESFHLMFGRTKPWSVAGPACGQRCVTFLVRVQKRMLSSPYWLRSPKAEFFQPPWL
jgi:hypothetical protein